MSGSNPFRRNLDGTGGSTTTSASTANQPSTGPSDLFDQLVQSSPTQLPNGYSGKPVVPPDLETDESTSSDDQAADPFNPASSTSDNEGDDRNQPARSLGSSTLDDRPRGSVGSAPHQALVDGSSISPESYVLSRSVEDNTQSSRGIGTASTTGPTSPEHDHGIRASDRARDKKPPPPPKSHHGKRISATPGAQSSAQSSTSTAPLRSTHRHSYHASSAESPTSARDTGLSDASWVPQPSPFESSSTSLEGLRKIESNETFSRSNSQQKRPPTPPASRRHSQMRRSKSAQSKSSGSRLTISSRNSESNDSSQPPSPGPSTRSIASSLSLDRKRISMPPPSSGDFRPFSSSTGDTLESLSSPAPSRPTVPGRRASSHGNMLSSSSSTYPPPPPPPRRARDSLTRSSEGGPAPRLSGEEMPVPQPSNAHDILADLSRLQKEVDDLRGSYENRKDSQ